MKSPKAKKITFSSPKRTRLYSPKAKAVVVKSPKRVNAKPKKTTKPKTTSTKTKTVKKTTVAKVSSPYRKSSAQQTSSSLMSPSLLSPSYRADNERRTNSQVAYYFHPELFSSGSSPKRSSASIEKWFRGVDSDTFLIFGKSSCPWCVKAKALVESRGLKYKFVDISDPSIGWTQENTLELREKTPGYTTVPRVFLGRKFIGGYTELEKRLL